MMDDSPSDADFDPRLFFENRTRRTHAQALGVEHVAHGSDWAEMRLPYDPALTIGLDSGILASGPIVALMDMACGGAVVMRQGRMRPMATLDLRIDYLRPALPGRAVVGRADCYRMTRSIAFVRGQAHDGDPADPVAYVVGTFMFTDAAG